MSHFSRDDHVNSEDEANVFLFFLDESLKSMPKQSPQRGSSNAVIYTVANVIETRRDVSDGTLGLTAPLSVQRTSADSFVYDSKQYVALEL